MDPKDPLRPVPSESGTLDEQLTEAQLLLKTRALDAAAEGITIADARLPDMPLIYANAGFERLTGYSATEVLGTNCRFLQGPGTDAEAAQTIREALDHERECVVEILNYRKDGSTFWNRLSITPVLDRNGQVSHFIGVQTDISDRKAAEDRLREANAQLEIHNRRMAGDIAAAARIQQSLLPVALPDFNGVEAAWTFRPCEELAGDTLNLIKLSDHELGVFIIDVSGHGLAAALLSVTLTHTLSADRLSSCLFTKQPSDKGFTPTPPPRVGEILNQQFQMNPRRTQYFTMVYGILDSRAWMFRYITAGHPPLIHLPQSGKAQILRATGFPVGLIEDVDYPLCSLQLSPGDRLFIYTDGVVEAESSANCGEQFGEDRLAGIIDECRELTLQESIDTARSRVEEWCGAYSPTDDLSLLALGIHAR